MIFLAATDGKTTIATDGLISGKATLQPPDTFDLRRGAAIAILKAYIDFARGDDPKHEMVAYPTFAVLYATNRQTVLVASQASRQSWVVPKYFSAEENARELKLHVVYMGHDYDIAMNEFRRMVPASESFSG